MTEREKVIKGLECCDNDDCDNCPYFRSCDEDDLGTCRATLHRDALALLKAQEPKPPIVKENNYGWKFFYCPSCGREFNANRKHGRMNEDNFCDKCGQAVKWDA